MSATMEYGKYNNGLTIDDFMEDRVIEYSPRTTAIINMCLANGTMGRTDQKKLRELYPNLFDEVQKFLAKKNRGNVFIYEEDGKPKVVNFFMYDKAGDVYPNEYNRHGAIKSFRHSVRYEKLPSYNFVFIHNSESRHSRMIENGLKYRLSWSYKLTPLRDKPIAEVA